MRSLRATRRPVLLVETATDTPHLVIDDATCLVTVAPAVSIRAGVHRTDRIHVGRRLAAAITREGRKGQEQEQQRPCTGRHGTIQSACRGTAAQHRAGPADIGTSRDWDTCLRSRGACQGHPACTHTCTRHESTCDTLGRRTGPHRSTTSQEPAPSIEGCAVRDTSSWGTMRSGNRSRGQAACA